MIMTGLSKYLVRDLNSEDLCGASFLQQTSNISPTIHDSSEIQNSTVVQNSNSTAIPDPKPDDAKIQNGATGGFFKLTVLIMVGYLAVSF